jgi:hypothetical protein
MWYVSKIVKTDYDNNNYEVDYLQNYNIAMSLQYVMFTDYDTNKSITIYSINCKPCDDGSLIIPFLKLKETLESLGITEVFGVDYDKIVIFTTTRFGSKLYDIIDYMGSESCVESFSNDALRVRPIYKNVVFIINEGRYIAEYKCLDKLIRRDCCRITNDYVYIINRVQQTRYIYKILDKVKFTKLNILMNM